MRRALATELSLGVRIGHTLLLLTSLSVATVTALLLATEPVLPPRTQVALGVSTAIGLSWTGFALWVLTKRRVLFASHRIVAARMAVAFSALFTVGALLVGPWGEPGWYGAVGVGLVMLGAAIGLLLAARRRFQELSALRVDLERELGRQGGSR